MICHNPGVTVWELQLVGFTLPFIVKFWPVERVAKDFQQVRPDHTKCQHRGSCMEA